jgi:hypothetical protein
VGMVQIYELGGRRKEKSPRGFLRYRIFRVNWLGLWLNME